MTMANDKQLDSTQKRVLIMDDETIIRQLVAEMLKMCGCHCNEAAEGSEAVELFRAAIAEGRPFDLVIMDLAIPGGIGGEEAVKQLLAINPTARVIVSSGSANDPVLENYHRYGFSGALRKPFRLTELQRLISEC